MVRFCSNPMKTSLLSHLLSLFALLAASANGATTPVTEPDLEGLPPCYIYSLGGRKFQADPYIAAAARLQALGKEAAFQRMGDFALRNSKNYFAKGHFYGRAEAIFVLCRMLFVARPGKPFRGPMLGAPTEDEEQAPLAPIHLIDGVPFFTVQYTLAGSPERPSAYLLYCITQCDWSSDRFAPKSMAEKQAALAKLLADRPYLKGREELKAQIEE